MKAIILFVMTLVALNLNAQDIIPNRFSYSFSWTPIYYGPNDDKILLDEVIPSAFEANICYNLKNRISIVSGLGFQKWNQMHKNGASDYYWTNLGLKSPVKSEKMHLTALRVPVQINYKLTRDGQKVVPYVRTEFVNEIGFYRSKYYTDGIYENSNNNKKYSASMNIGYGSLFYVSKSIILLTELSMGTYFSSGPVDALYIKLKIGILIK